MVRWHCGGEFLCETNGLQDILDLSCKHRDQACVNCDKLSAITDDRCPFGGQCVLCAGRDCERI